MKRVTFTIERLQRMPRPAGYMDELRAVAISADDRSMTFDADAEPYKALKEKYSVKSPDLSCIHRGAQTRTIECPTCSNTTTRLKVFACSQFGECTISKKVDGIATCPCPKRITP